MKQRNVSGFTIVELLIVIVVIGILAAITIVAYNGMQERTRNQQTVAAVSSYAKAMMLYAAENGAYPPNSGPWPCLGTGYVCDGTSTLDSTAHTQALLNDLSPYMQSVPQPAVGAQVTQRTGALYAYNYFLFIQEGQSTCPAIGSLTQRQAPEVSGSDIACRYNLPDIK